MLEKFGVEMIGANADTIDKAEDRSRFDKAMKNIGLACPVSGIAHNMDEAYGVLDKVGFPCIIRPSFTMGGTGGGIAYNREEFEEICARGLDLSPTSELLIDESLIGWKEYEMEVVRDKKDNCIIVCSIENFDPMGVHTGDSITVAPAQTLTDKEYQIMRNASLAVLREIGVENRRVQRAVRYLPEHRPYGRHRDEPACVAFLGAGLQGHRLPHRQDRRQAGRRLYPRRAAERHHWRPHPGLLRAGDRLRGGQGPAFRLRKIPQGDARLTTQMKSVGEVMAIGRTFQESMQKALRGLEVGATGFDPKLNLADAEAESTLKRELTVPGAERIWYVADAFRAGKSVEDVFALTKIDPWFLVQIEDLVKEEEQVKTLGLSSIDRDLMYKLKRKGFSDARLAKLLGVTEKNLRSHRHKLKVLPVYKRVDTCAAEFATDTAYMYSTYEEECEANPSSRDKIMILGGGPNRIGQGIEFDYCCVHAALAMREDGYETIMVNCNPETVSTDYDTSDRLYFEPVTLEDVLEIVRVEQPKGVIVQYGGQTPLKICRALEEAGVPIIGTSPDAIDRAEDRERFQQMVQRLNLRQPQNATARSEEEAIAASKAIGYPLVVRPSYVLGGRAMEIVYEEEELKRYMREAVQVSNDSPVLLDHFLNCAIEVDVDAVCDGEQVVIGAIMQHIEQAGVHSGDSACSLPAYSLPQHIQDEIREQVRKMALELDVVGLMNVQMAVQGEDIYVLEVNPRASRTVPFVSKCIGESLAKVAARVMAGKTLAEIGFTKEIIPPFFSVKEAVFPFAKFPGVDTILGPEMKSTGEVMGVGDSFAEAFAKAQLGASEILPTSGCAFISVREDDKPYVEQVARDLIGLGFEVVATAGTARIIEAAGLPVRRVNKVTEGRPHVVDMIKNDEVTLIINTTEGRQSIADSYSIRRNALQHKICITTTIAGGQAICEALKFGPEKTVRRLQDLHAGIHA